MIFELLLLAFAIAVPEVHAQTQACHQPAMDEIPQLAITVTYTPNEPAHPPERAVEIQRRLNGGAWSPVLSLPPRERSFVDNSARPGTVVHKYEYQIRIVNDHGVTAWVFACAEYQPLRASTF